MTLLATTTHNSLAVWSALSAVLLALLAAVCAFFPRFLLFLAATANHHVSADDYTVLTPLESFLAVQLSLVLAALSLALILNRPNVLLHLPFSAHLHMLAVSCSSPMISTSRPLPNRPATTRSGNITSSRPAHASGILPSPESPEAVPTGALNYNPVTQATTTQPLLLPLSLAALLSALHAWNTQGVGALGLMVFAGSLTVGLWGMWEIVFAGPPSVSKTTGADKRTSAFLFGNKAAASSQKKSFRKGM
ncbi:hypothetical protein D9619_005638 [Psilocybe cf. subviscida]|uniref:Uncharacterized protein n=1 Tax=Psilocybe cf. subviscida TaxID=2480587 RepID=A0A8H5BWK7_9AGAR|nr:hypothetical protein D9619_005638 [Psilocybe cf. subviscida]